MQCHRTTEPQEGSIRLCNRIKHPTWQIYPHCSIPQAPISNGVTQFPCGTENVSARRIVAGRKAKYKFFINEPNAFWFINEYLMHLTGSGSKMKLSFWTYRAQVETLADMWKPSWGPGYRFLCLTAVPTAMQIALGPLPWARVRRGSDMSKLCAICKIFYDLHLSNAWLIL